MAGRNIILIGGGEHARVVAECVRSAGRGEELLGFVARSRDEAAERRLELCYLGDDARLEQHHRDATPIIAFGAMKNWSRRLETVRRVSASVRSWATVVHGAAWVSPSARIGEGTAVMAGAVVQTGARIGAHCVINSGAIVEHDVEIGENVHVGPAVAIGGGSSIGEGAYLGLGARVRDHVRIGADAVVAMGAVVVRDVPNGARVMGVPAR